MYPLGAGDGPAMQAKLGDVEREHLHARMHTHAYTCMHACARTHTIYRQAKLVDPRKLDAAISDRLRVASRVTLNRTHRQS